MTPLRSNLAGDIRTIKPLLARTIRLGAVARGLR